MADFEKKKKLRKILYSKGMLCVLFLLIIFFSTKVYSMYGKFKESRQDNILAEQQLQAAETQENQLQTSINMLNTDEGTEEVIRNKFRDAKQGEGLVVIENSSNITNGSTSTDSTGLWGFLKGL